MRNSQITRNFWQIRIHPESISSIDNNAGVIVVGEGDMGDDFSGVIDEVSGTADNAEAFVESYETEGGWFGGTFTYDSGSTITNDNSISYTISLKIYTWDIQNVRETII